MLTIFTHTKAFKGHVGLIQRNAISQWARLRPRPEILLFGNREGTADIAQELGLRHIPEVERNEFGTPLLSDIFEKAHALASHKILCYVNADIILLCDFMGAVERVASWRDRFLMVGRRTNVDLDEPAIYESPGQETRLRALVLQQNPPVNFRGIDYFVFPHGLFAAFPRFAIGRPWWDNWVLWKVRKSGVPLVDASAVVLAVHQNHDYSLPEGAQDVMQREEAKQNRKLAGHGFCTIADATYRLTSAGIAYNFSHLLVPIVLPWWWAFLKITGPIRYPLGLRRGKIASVLGRIKLLAS